MLFAIGRPKTTTFVRMTAWAKTPFWFGVLMTNAPKMKPMAEQCDDNVQQSVSTKTGAEVRLAQRIEEGHRKKGAEGPLVSLSRKFAVNNLEMHETPAKAHQTGDRDYRIEGNKKAIKDVHKFPPYR